MRPSEPAGHTEFLPGALLLGPAGPRSAGLATRSRRTQMGRSTFVFLHVGADVVAPTLLVASIRKHLPDAEIIQCADGETPAIPGVTRTHRSSGNTGNLMTFRLDAFAGLGLEDAAAYLDTDMLLVRPLDPEKVLGSSDVALCERSFDRQSLFNPSFRGMDLSEYANRTLGEVYPYIACFTAVRGPGFWQSCCEELQTLPDKFHSWYGDQEAIRNVAARGAWRVSPAPERVYACLPEHAGRSGGTPRLLHFKGPSRKGAMLDWAKRLGLAAA